MVHALHQFFKSKWVYLHAAERSEGIEVPMHIVRVAAGLCFGPIVHVQPGLDLCKPIMLVELGPMPMCGAIVNLQKMDRAGLVGHLSGPIILITRVYFQSFAQVQPGLLVTGPIPQ